MSEAPLVSIIVPCYNYGHFLSDTLEGIQAQHFKNWECIVIDDGSTDNTAAIAAGFAEKDGRILYIHQSNAGLSAARNAGLAAARGMYIQLLDADDGIAPQKLDLQTAFLDAHPGADLVYGDALYFSEDISRLSPDRHDLPGAGKQFRLTACGKDLLALLTRDNIMEVSCPLMRSSLVGRVGLFDTQYTSFEDWQYWIRCALAGACFHYLPLQGTETYIRYGHSSMMRHLRRMNEAGIRIRRYLRSHLAGRQAWYNQYRLWKLGIKKLWLSLQR